MTKQHLCCIFNIMKKLIKDQEGILKALADKIDDFYLTGGTALSLFYFHHRQSEDLDFFTQKFDRSRANKIMEDLSKTLNIKFELIGEQSKKDRARMIVYFLRLKKDLSLKVDFVEDYLKLTKPPKKINGIFVLSLEDIYLRKIYTITGSGQTIDFTGRKKIIDGRKEAKDFYDLYCLSHIYGRLSHFVFKYGDAVMREGLIHWFCTYNRMEMKTGLLELKMDTTADFPIIERHFKKEIDKILEKEVEFL